MGRVLSEKQFSIVAAAGLGRTSAGTVHAMALFRGEIYAATACSDGAGTQNAPRVLRYGVKGGTWTTAYESPLIDPHARSRLPDRQRRGIAPIRRLKTNEQPIPRDAGYRSMCVFQGKSDRAPALYASTMSRTGGILLRSADGKKFEAVGEPGLGDPSVYSFRSLVAHEGRMFAVPAGQITDDYVEADIPSGAKVLVSDDPARGKWEAASDLGFGDPANVAVSLLYPAFGRLYAGTANPDFGFQLWQSEARGAPPFEWLPVLIDGGAAFNRSFTVSAMAEFNGALYVGSGMTGFGYNAVYDVGPASGELLRVQPDGKWDLIVGQMRFTPDGLKVPQSLLGPGLDDFYNSLVCSLGVHEGVLYLGTDQWEAVRCLEIKAADIVGGYQLWASTDGEKWSPVINDGHGNPANFAIRAMLSTPRGLLLGTDNQSRLLGKLAGKRTTDFKAGFEILLGR